MGSNSPSTTFWSDHPTHATIRISAGRSRGIAIPICFNKKEKPLQSVNQNSLVMKSGCWKSPHVSPQMHRVGEYKSRMQKPNSSPPSFSSLLSSSSVWNRESSWMQQGVGCGSFFTTQMWVGFFFFFYISFLPLGGRAEADFFAKHSHMSTSGGSHLRVELRIKLTDSQHAWFFFRSHFC